MCPDHGPSPDAETVPKLPKGDRDYAEVALPILAVRPDSRLPSPGKSHPHAARVPHLQKPSQGSASTRKAAWTPGALHRLPLPCTRVHTRAHMLTCTPHPPPATGSLYPLSILPLGLCTGHFLHPGNLAFPITHTHFPVLDSSDTFPEPPQPAGPLIAPGQSHLGVTSICLWDIPVPARSPR